MENVLGVRNATQECRFEQRTVASGLIDVLIPAESALVEQKASGVDRSSMIGHESDIFRPFLTPFKSQSVLIVYPDAVLPFPVTNQLLKSI